VRLSALEPVGLQQFEGDTFVQVEVSGEQGATRCGALVAARLVRPVAAVEETPLRPLPAPAKTRDLVTRWRAGDDGVLDALADLDLDAQFDALDRLALTRAASSAVLFERLSSDHRLPAAVRRAAVRRLTPAWSSQTLAELVARESAWTVRLEAAYALLPVVERALLPGGGDATAFERLLVERILQDDAEPVRRNVLARLPGLVMVRHADRLRPLLAEASPNVRAVAIETFAAASLAPPRDLASWLEGDAVAVRVAAGAALVSLGRREDVPRLWRHLSSDVRAVRLAVSPLLERLDDESIGPSLWRLLVEESLEPEPDEPYRRRLADALDRHPFDALAPMLAAHLDGERPFRERLLLATLLAAIDPPRAREALSVDWGSTARDRRLIAAATAPDDPGSRERRHALLTDVDDDLRAAAILGLCRWAETPDPALDEVELAPRGLGPDAMRARASCGAARVSPRRWRTTLEAAATAGPTSWSTPAAALVLLGLGFVLTRPGTSRRTRRTSPGS
jgi:hypothetical protein